MKQVFKMITVVIFLTISFQIKAQVPTVQQIDHAISDCSMSNIGPVLNLFTRLGYKTYKNNSSWEDEYGNIVIPTLYGRGCQKVITVPIRNRGGEEHFKAAPANASASLGEVLTSGDGTLLGVRVTVYNRAQALKWVDQLKQLGYTCDAPGGIMGYTAWYYTKYNRPPYTIWQQDENTYILIAG